MKTVAMINSRIQLKTKSMHMSIQMSRKEMYETRGTFCRTELNIAVRVRRVVIPIPTLPGTDSAEINRDSQASILTKIMMMMMMIMMMQKTYSPQTQQKVYMSGLHDNQSAW